MVNILILGSTGMLGSSVYYELSKNRNYTCSITHRNEKVKLNKESIFFDALKTDKEALARLLNGYDYVINCIGVIKPFMHADIESSIEINSLLPHKLAIAANFVGAKLLHITTDCVFSGLDGGYHENSKHDCLDEYGKSKSLGEPINDAMVIRTSIIGNEIHKNASLIAWALSMDGKKVNGFTNHIWNGVTTNTFGKVCSQIIDRDLYEQGLFHVFSPNSLTKYEMLELVCSEYGLNVDITPHSTPQKIDRTLSTRKTLLGELEVDTINNQIKYISQIYKGEN